MGSLGVAAFSLTLPATRVAVPALGAGIITFGRIEVAAALAVVTLLVSGAPRPAAHQLGGLLLTGLGLAIGFPLFLALALASAPAGHGAVVVGRTFRPADLYLFAAVLSVDIGYVEGGIVARQLGGLRVLCWALILVAPLGVVPLVLAVAHQAPGPVSGPAWIGFWYVALVSMFLGSVAWYRGLAAGGIARIGQLQLAQPLLALLWSALLLGEHVSPGTLLAAVLVLAAMAVCIRSRVPAGTAVRAPAAREAAGSRA